MKIPYGDADFAKIRRKGMFYVDKTPFLPELERDDLGYSKLVFLRPRRFGKSLLVSMLEYYYDLSRANEFDELFQGLWIHEHPTPEQNKYIVLNLNFSRVATDQGMDMLLASFRRAMLDSMLRVIERYAGRFPAIDQLKAQLDAISSADGLIGAFMTAVGVSGQELYLLIDEYDTFANAPLSTEQTDLYSKVTDKAGFVRTFYRTVKVGTETGAIARVFITGASPILLDDLMTGFNVTTNISNRLRFNSMVGFTRADVERAVDELLRDQPDLQSIPGIGDREALIDTLEQHYDGYRFSEDATERVFNSDLVLYFLREIADRKKYPKTMLDPNARTDYKKLHRLWAATGPAAEERRKALETILSEGHIWSDLVEQFGQSTRATTSQFVSLMYYTGMLTLSPEPPDVNYYRFETPNRVIRQFLQEHLTRPLEDSEISSRSC